MSSAAEQYRALVAKLEAINPSGLKVGDIDPVTGLRITSENASNLEKPTNQNNAPRKPLW